MIHGFLYDVKVQASFTLEEVEFMMLVAEHHYDAKIKALPKQGGKLFGMRNAAIWSKEEGRLITYSMEFGDADSLMKCMEQSSWHHKDVPAEQDPVTFCQKICKQLQDIMSQINIRYLEVRKAFEKDSYYDHPNGTSDTF